MPVKQQVFFSVCLSDHNCEKKTESHRVQVKTWRVGSQSRGLFRELLMSVSLCETKRSQGSEDKYQWKT